jgi:hypothetical protein
MIEPTSAILTAASGGTSWTGIVLAVLGSSAVGAIAGGYLTTRLRGDIERDEAWRTRLIDAADGFLAQLATTLNAIPHSWLVAIESGDQDLRADDGLTAPALQVAAAFESERTQLMPLFSRLELLFGADASGPAREALRTLVNAREVLTGASWIPEAMRLWGAKGLGVNIEDLIDDGFDPDDDASVAALTRELLESVPRHQQELLRLCAERIRADHPGRLAGR